MKIVLEENPGFTETEVVIRCKEATPQVMGILAALRSFDQRLTGTREGRTYLFEAGQVLYIESVDKRTFLYTAEGVYETPLRLYELEERLASWDFVRASKSVIVNFGRVSSRPGRPPAADPGKRGSGGGFEAIRPGHSQEAGHVTM